MNNNIYKKQQYIAKYQFQFCDDSNEKYKKLMKIGQGTFGEVFKAEERSNPNNLVAMKRIFMDNEIEGFPITALREIKILQRLRHNNIVHLIEICRTKATLQNKYRSTFHLIFEFCEHDLAGLLSNRNVVFNLAEIKKVLHQLLSGLYYIHANKILHRDLKTANILITKKGVLKLADFGLARAFSIKADGKSNRYTNRVVTLWYRPPELLLGERNYGTAIDMWGAGCIMAEMWTRRPILQGNTEQAQLKFIGQFCGSIGPNVWPGVENLELYNKMELIPNEKRKVVTLMKNTIKDAHGCDLLDKLLTLDPIKRIDADNALNHDFFWSDPMPCDLETMMAKHSQSMFELYNRQAFSRYQHQQSVGNQKPHPSQNKVTEYHDRTY